MKKERQKRNRSLALILVIMVALFAGLSFLALDLLMRVMEPIQMLTVRWTISAVIFLVLIVLGIVKVDFRSPYLKYLILAGLAEPCIYSTIEAYGIHLTSASISAMFVAVIPCMTLLISIVFLRKKAAGLNVLGILLAFAGVLIFTVFSPTFTGGGDKTGFFCMGIAVMAASLYVHFSAKASLGYNALTVTAAMAIEGAILYNAICLVRGDLVQAYVIGLGDWRLLAGLLFLSVGCCFGCYGGTNKLLAIMDTSTAVNLTQGGATVVGVLSGILIVGNPWGWYTVVGMVVTLLGVWLSSRSLQTQRTEE